MNALKQPLSNVQLELLKAFSHNFSTQELKDLLAHFFAKRAIRAANKAWKENNWTDADIDKMLETKNI